jgi:hypothetical protein
MAENKSRKGGSLFGASGLALIMFGIMIGSYIGADWLKQNTKITPDIALAVTQLTQYVSKLSLVILMVWIYTNIGFPRTIGRDYAQRFEKGWTEMPDTDAVKWMVVLFLGLFLGAALLMPQ